MSRVSSFGPEFEEALGEWRNETRRDFKDDIYRDHLFGPIMDRFGKLELSNAPGGFSGEKSKYLISILGFSWQPVVLGAGWVEPERMLLIGTRESTDPELTGWDIRELLSDLAGINPDFVDIVTVEDPLENRIYEEVRDFLRKVDSDRTILDPTGGKKSMSAAAALAAFVADIPLIYVDSTDYTGTVPVPGTEFPRYLANPLVVFGDLELERIRRAFNQGAYVDAKQGATRLAARSDLQEANLFADLALAYGAWDAFDTNEAHTTLVKAVGHVDLKSVLGIEDAKQIGRHVEVLKILEAGGDNELHVAALLSAAERRIQRGRSPEAVMLIWSAVEFGAHSWLRSQGIFENSMNRGDLVASLEAVGVDPVKYLGETGTLHKMESVLLAVDVAGVEVDRRPLEKLWEHRNASAFAHGRRGRIFNKTAKGHQAVAIEAANVWFPNMAARLEELAFPILKEFRRG